MSDRIKRWFHRLPWTAELVRERDELRRACGIAPPGHFYSPLPDFAAVMKDADRIFAPPPAEPSLTTADIAGIELRESAQLELLGEFAQIYADLPFTAQPDPARRYHYENGNFSYSDAIMLACMIRHSNAKQLVEVGSGFSSCLTLDVNELFMRGAMSLTFIEPFPALLHSLLRPQEVAGLCILAQPVQDVALSTFSGLRRGDILRRPGWPKAAPGTRPICCAPSCNTTRNSRSC